MRKIVLKYLNYSYRLNRFEILLFLLCFFLFGYYFQLILWFSHVRMGFTADIFSITNVFSSTSNIKLTDLSKDMLHIIFVCKKTNWDYLGLFIYPNTYLLAHEDVAIPYPIESFNHIIRHDGNDNYWNLHNKTHTILHYIQKLKKEDNNNDRILHFLKQDDDAIVYWPHFYSCLNKCNDLDLCYAGDMHVNIGNIKNINSYVFATGGSYFIGSKLIDCLINNDFTNYYNIMYVEVNGLDYGEDKTIGKMLHYYNCKPQIVSCKWFNNKEIYTNNMQIIMKKKESWNLRPEIPLKEKDRNL